MEVKERIQKMEHKLVYELMTIWAKDVAELEANGSLRSLDEKDWQLYKDFAVKLDKARSCFKNIKELGLDYGL